MNTGTRTSYVVGFVLSVLLTLGAYFVVAQHLPGEHPWLSHRVLIGAVVGLAVIQLMVQLFFFLHLGRESKPRWNLTVFLFALMVVTIVVGGSLWIMKNLDYHMMSPDKTDTFIIKDEGVHK
ncbi:MAG: putative cytochrome ubiquinol oxidase chain cyoD [Patescibacteria group bacterium]|nr:putative cytochrome ubiquinol oxidase chain cyoD [Patescibacteria group bacterium]